MRRLLSLLAVAAFALPVRSPAQLLDAKVLSIDAAKRMVAAAEAEARKNGWNVGLVPVEGRVPISAGGKVLGGIGVTGVTSQQDAQVAQAGAAALSP